jgi:hypothetical protein
MYNRGRILYRFSFSVMQIYNRILGALSRFSNRRGCTSCRGNHAEVYNLALFLRAYVHLAALQREVGVLVVVNPCGQDELT